MANVLLELDEENQLEFQISLRGSTSNVVGPPTIRFLIAEKNGNIGVALPAKHGEDGVVKVIIPSLKSIFSENNEYVGKLEVIVGNKYFAPTSMDIKFNKSIEVNAVPVIKRQQQQPKPLPESAKANVAVGNDQDTGLDESLDLDSFIKAEVTTKQQKHRQPKGSAALTTNYLAAQALWEKQKQEAMALLEEEEEETTLEAAEDNVGKEVSKQETRNGILAKNVKKQGQHLLGDEHQKELTKEELSARIKLKAKLKSMLASSK